MKRFAAVLLTATAAAVLMAQTDQMPKRKPGLWEMTTISIYSLSAINERTFMQKCPR